jgi:flagellum-specific ATP synthase
MSRTLSNRIDQIRGRLGNLTPQVKVGRVVQVTGLIIESIGPDLSLGELCTVSSDRSSSVTRAEVVGFREERLLLMPLTPMRDIHVGAIVRAAGFGERVPIGEKLLGRVIDGMGAPIDEKGPLGAPIISGLQQSAPNPLKRARINRIMTTGVRSIDLFTPLGYGQRVGIFSGSGVGKSTLLGMVARGSDADVNVIALIGERGRELREFMESDLKEAGLARSVVVASTSDQPAPLRVRAAQLATRIAEDFRSKGRRVMLMMDSLTRLAMAQREIGLAIGEPPTSRGYTPSVFALLPKILERTGMDENGAITALYTVLVEGDDMNEPIADAARGILDGHIILSRQLATANHYPPVDVLESLSRLARTLTSSEEYDLISSARDLLANYRKNEDLIQVGAYTRGSSPQLDRAIAKYTPIMDLLKQHFNERADRAQSLERLREILAK